MAHTARSVDALEGARRVSRGRRVLPVRSPAEAVARLAPLWRDATGARVAVVSAVAPLAQRLTGCLAAMEGAIEPVEIAWTPSASWSGEAALAALLRDPSFARAFAPYAAGAANAAAESADSTEAIAACEPFHHEGRVLGGVWFARSRNDEHPSIDRDAGSDSSDRDEHDRDEHDCDVHDRGEIAALAEWSAQVLAQAELMISPRDEADPNAAFAEQLERAKLEALAEFAAGAGHEINNPLATISGRVQMLLKDETDPDRRQALTTIGGQALRIRDMIGDLMLFGRPPVPRPESANLGDAAADVLARLKEKAGDRQCRLVLHCTEAVEVWADPVQLRVVISSLVANSLEAQRPGGEVVVSVSPAAAHEGAGGWLTVSDRGPGLNESERAHLFDPFFSGRQAGRGLGFGLSKCWRIVTGHRGRIEVDTGSEGGIAFRVFWPAEPSQG